MNNLDLARAVLEWWKDAQYWESYPGRNMFDDDPEFVQIAERIVEERTPEQLESDFDE